MINLKKLLNIRGTVAAVVLALVLLGCADEELAPPSSAGEPTAEPVLQPAEENAVEQVPVEPAESYPAPGEGEVESGAPTEPYPAADEGATDGSPERPESYPAPAEGDAAPEGAVVTPLGETETYVVVSDNSLAQYEVDEEFFNRDVKFVTAIGTTNEINGALVLDLSGSVPKIVDGVFTVDLSTLTSDSRRRDDAIRQDWLESSAFPEASFVAREVAAFPEDYAPGSEAAFQLIGDLTIRNITNEVVWDVVAQLDGPTLTATATTFIFMADYGFEPPSVFNILQVTDGVTVTVNITAEVP